MRRVKITFIAVVLLCIITACGNAEADYSETNDSKDAIPVQTGQIFLFGERHGCADTMDKQLEIWGNFYHQYGMRHLFLEMPYFGAQWLNLWMHSDDDVILYEMFDDIAGTLSHVPHTLIFFRTIKQEFPGTIFHGTDVGHQSDTQGQRFLQYLYDNDMQDTESYTITRMKMAQFERFMEEVATHGEWHAHAVRAYYKPQNFIREFDQLAHQNVMAIHGMLHVELTQHFKQIPNVPSMAYILRERYGDALHTFNMDVLLQIQEPLRIEEVVLGGMAFEGSYFGAGREVIRDEVARFFWRVEDAPEVIRSSPPAGIAVPFDHFPMTVEVGQVFIIDFHQADGSVLRRYFAARGNYQNGRPVAEQFFP